MHYNADTFDDYLRNELGTEQDAVIHLHLESCTDCRGLYDEAVALRDWVRTSARAEELEFSSMISARVWQQIRETSRPTLADRFRAFFKPMIAVPVVAGLAAVAYLGIPAVHGSGTAPAGVAATYLLEEHAAMASDNPLADRGLIVPASAVDSTTMVDGSESDQ